jgi:hypothetical protein
VHGASVRRELNGHGLTLVAAARGFAEQALSELPSGWTEIKDISSGRVAFWNVHTKQVWHPARPLWCVEWVEWKGAVACKPWPCFWGYLRRTDSLPSVTTCVFLVAHVAPRPRPRPLLPPFP